MALSEGLLRFIQLGNRIMQWASSVIIMGITAFFIHKGPHGEHIEYEIVIATLSVVVFLPALAQGFVPRLTAFVMPIDLIFSYLWLTSFIFTAEDYDWHSCYANAPPGRGCSVKRASEAFTFLAFFFTFVALCVDIGFIFPKRETATTTHSEKSTPATTGATNGAGTTATTDTTAAQV